MYTKTPAAHHNDDDEQGVADVYKDEMNAKLTLKGKYDGDTFPVPSLIVVTQSHQSGNMVLSHDDDDDNNDNDDDDDDDYDDEDDDNDDNDDDDGE